MRVLESSIFDFINKCLFFIQSKTEGLKQKSFILQNIDFFIFLCIISVYILSVSASNGLIAAAASAAVLVSAAGILISKGEKIELESCNFYLIIYLFICLISCFASSLPVLSFYGFSKTLLYTAFYFALCSFFKRNKGLAVPVFFVIGFLAAAESVIGIIQNHTGILSLASWQDTSYTNPENILARVYGTLKPYNPNLFGGWLIVCAPALLGLSALCFYKKKTAPAVIYAAAFFISALCIFYTGCRGAYGGLLVIMLCLLAVLFRMNNYAKAAAGVIAASGAAFILTHQSILQRIMSIFLLRGDSSASFRMNVYKSSFQMFLDNPIFGIGAGNKVFREIYGLYMLSGFDALSAYCVFLETAVESGIFALAAFVLFIGSLLKGALKKPEQEGSAAEKIVIFTAFVSILAAMAHGIIDTVFFRPQIQFVFWTMAAVITAFSRKA